MAQDFVVYVDFDSTLYNTGVFANELWSMIAYKSGKDIDTVRADGTSLFSHPKLSGYEYEAHTKSYGLKPNEMWDALDNITDREDYLFFESAEFMRSLRADGYNPRILTFGEKKFQLAKIHPMLKYLVDAGSVNTLDVTVVDKKKNQHIRNLHGGQAGVLVDDKPDQQLPTGFTEIHINRNSLIVEPAILKGVATVSDLCQARKVIDLLNRYNL